MTFSLKMDASAVRYLANLKQKGILCVIDDINRTNNAIISGRIVKVLPLIQKSPNQPRDVVIFHLKEVYSASEFNRKTFRVIFVDKAAQLVNNLSLVPKDDLLFCNPELTSDVTYKRQYGLHNKQLVVGLWPINKIENFYYRRKGSEIWSQLPSHCNEDDIHDTAVMRIFSDDDDCDDNDISILENDAYSSKAKASSSSAITLKQHKEQNDESVASKNQIISAPTCSKSIMSDFANVLQVASSTKNCSNHKKMLDINHYTKLGELKEGTKINAYCILLKIIKGPTCIDKDRYEILINVTDDERHDDFLVLICAKTIDIFQKLQPYCIIRLHRLSVVERLGELNGELNGGDLLVFDKNDINITYGASSTFPLPESHKKRIQELKNWMLENIPASRSFTALSELDMKHQKINLNGQVVNVKVYEGPSSVVAIRISDGTQCKIPHHHLSLNNDTWMKVLTTSKACYSESDEIDIIVTEPAKNFKLIKVGDKIELYNVEVIVKSEFLKTKRTDYITLNMKGIWHNLQCIISFENRTPAPVLQDTQPKELSHTALPQTPIEAHEENNKKRKLFNPEICVNFESDDSENIDTNNKNKNISAEKNSPKNQTSAPALQDTQPKELFCTALSQTATEAYEENEKRKVNTEKCVNFKSDDSENVDTNNKNKNIGVEKNFPKAPALQGTQPKELFCTALSQTTTEAHEENKKRKLNPEMCVNLKSDDSENIDTNNKNKNISIEKHPPKKRCRNDASSEKNDNCFVTNSPIEANCDLNECEANIPISNLPVESICDLNECEENIPAISLPVESTCDLNLCEENTPAMVPIEENRTSEEVVFEIERSEENVQNQDFSKKTEQNYVTTWPQPPRSDPFNILVNLLTTNPMFDDESSDFDVLSIIKAHCENCSQIFSCQYAKWVHVEDEVPEAICLKCKTEGRINDVSFLIKFELVLNDEKNNLIRAVILGDHAEKFLGFSVKEICSSPENRCKIKEQLEVWKKKPFIVEITPVNVEKHKYHVTSVKSFS